MSGPHDAHNASSSDGLSWWKILLLLEGCALLIGLIMPVTPSKTGRPTSLAKYFFDRPGYLHEALVSFILTNLLIAVLGLALLVYSRWYQRRQGRG